MINLEWLRTFRAVYKFKSLSTAAEKLAISQPTVSQHLSALEARIGKKLFTRQSKGVLETDMGRILNTMISGSMEELETVEEKIVKKDTKLKNILTIGISPHLYKSVLCNTLSKLGDFVHIKFDQKDNLIEQVERGELQYAIIHEHVERFDLYCYPLQPQKLVLTATVDIDLKEFEDLYAQDHAKSEKWLKNHKWYAHDHNSTFIKFYWMNLFDKKRPSIVPNYVVPNEYEVLFQQSNGSGLSVAFDNVAHHFVTNGELQSISVKNVEFRKLHLIANTKKTSSKITDKIVDTLKKANSLRSSITSSS